MTYSRRCRISFYPMKWTRRTGETWKYITFPFEPLFLLAPGTSSRVNWCSPESPVCVCKCWRTMDAVRSWIGESGESLDHIWCNVDELNWLIITRKGRLVTNAHAGIIKQEKWLWAPPRTPHAYNLPRFHLSFKGKTISKWILITFEIKFTFSLKFTLDSKFRLDSNSILMYFIWL